jgi:NAD(P)-dependent dehydrogenase (short-subunit alcohol dehydrogenase family)
MNNKGETMSGAMSSAKQRVLLIGVTGGCGGVTGDKLIAAGYEVIATCRESHREKIQASGKFHQVIALDLASNDSVEAAFAELKRLGITKLDALVNCAAIDPASPMETVSLDEMHRVYQINIFGTLRAVQLAIPLLRENGGGRIVLVGSLAGSYVMPMMGIYSSSKFALEGAVDALRRELYPWNITTSIVKPGAILTAMFFDHLKSVEQRLTNLQGADKHYEKLYRAHAREIPRTQSIAVSTEEVANDIMRALTSSKQKSRYFSGTHSRLTGLFVRFTPDSVQDWLAKKIFKLK